MQIKQSASQRVLVRLLDVAGVPVTGKIYSDVTAVIGKSDTTEATLSLSAGDWAEADNGLVGKGVYWLTIPTTATDQLGDLVYCVSVSGAVDFVRNIEVVANLASDIYPLVQNLPDVVKVLLNRAKINSVTNRLEIYESDGVSLAFSFELKDLTGTPTSTGATERVPT